MWPRRSHGMACASASGARRATGPPSSSSPAETGSRAGILPDVLATVTAYSVGLFIHILAVVLAFGPTFGYGFFIGFADNRASAAVPAVHRAVRMTNLYLVTPAMIVVLAAGLYLVAKEDLSMSESWITVGLIAIVVLFGLVY